MNYEFFIEIIEFDLFLSEMLQAFYKFLKVTFILFSSAYCTEQLVAWLGRDNHQLTKVQSPDIISMNCEYLDDEG